jgi:hypothetical protein
MKMKINIEGDMNKDDLLKIGKFLTELFHGRAEHINVYILEGTEDMTTDAVAEFMGKMFGDFEHHIRFFKPFLRDNDDRGRGDEDKKT